MSISSISSYNPLTSTTVTPPLGSDPTQAASDGTQQVHHHHGHGHGHGGGGGQVKQAVDQALQSLGLSLPGKTDATSAATSATGTDATTSTTGTDSTSATSSTDSTSGVHKDMQDFMHALFEAVKSDSSSSSSGDSSSGSDPKSNFAAGLSTLISQVSNGTAPTDLQNAFTKLQGDLQQTGSTAATSATQTASSTANNAQATLQNFLTQLQQNLGYGASAGLAATGNVISTQA